MFHFACEYNKMKQYILKNTKMKVKYKTIQVVLVQYDIPSLLVTSGSYKLCLLLFLIFQL